MLCRISKWEYHSEVPWSHILAFVFLTVNPKHLELALPHLRSSSREVDLKACVLVPNRLQLEKKIPTFLVSPPSCSSFF